MNKCYIISREQVTNELKIQMADSIGEDKHLCSLNKQHYIDAVYLTLDDLKKLSDEVDNATV